MTQARPYGGVDAADRLARRRAGLLEAGLELLGTDIDPPNSPCAASAGAGRGGHPLLLRELRRQGRVRRAVFDWVVAELAVTTRPPWQPRRPPSRTGRASPAWCAPSKPIRGSGGCCSGPSCPTQRSSRKRQELGPLFAVLGGQHAEATLNRPANDRIKAFAHFVVGGVGQTIGGWLAGDVDCRPTTSSTNSPRSSTC